MKFKLVVFCLLPFLFGFEAFASSVPVNFAWCSGEHVLVCAQIEHEDSDLMHISAAPEITGSLAQLLQISENSVRMAVEARVVIINHRNRPATPILQIESAD